MIGTKEGAFSKRRWRSEQLNDKKTGAAESSSHAFHFSRVVRVTGARQG
jgi:hypothetical protein